MKHVILWSAAAAFLLGIFETAILSHVRFLPVLPDLILILVVYTALYNGSTAGVTVGFFSGLLFDFLSLAPLGLHSWIFILIGFLYGILYRKYNVRRILFPLVLVFSATLLKAFFLFALRFLFGQSIQTYNMVSMAFWSETALNTLCAPVLFALFALFPGAFEMQDQ
nr:rod shape-determining protein MreD [uncultured Treponema sp.]